MSDARIPTADEVREEVRAWLAANWDPELPLAEWRATLADSGWACPSWPTRWHGRGLPVAYDSIVADAIYDAGAVGPAVGGGMGLAAPTILAVGNDEVKARFLRRIITGEDTWCQLFSEPTNGSDLAGLMTHAVRDGDEWIVNGQKVWNTSAHHADYGMLLARTDWDVPKHKGITYLVLPMHQPGVEVRPLKQSNGHASFNEVFMSDARIPGGWVVGDVGEGWRSALATLAHERRFGALARPRFGGEGRCVREARAEAEDYYKVYSWYPQRAGRVDLLIEHARARGVQDDPIVRQAIAETLSLYRANQWMAQRAAAARRLGREPGAEGSLGKLGTSVVARSAAKAHALIARAEGLLTGTPGELDGIVAEVLISVPAQSIAGGTDEIQHNILGEQVLGLPKEPQVDRDGPFRDAVRAAGLGAR
jgi:alkylation response protein AidB-like acyl-CoA dehydrogenase